LKKYRQFLRKLEINDVPPPVEVRVTGRGSVRKKVLQPLKEKTLQTFGKL